MWIIAIPAEQEPKQEINVSVEKETSMDELQLELSLEMKYEVGDVVTSDWYEGWTGLPLYVMSIEQFDDVWGYYCSPYKSLYPKNDVDEGSLFLEEKDLKPYEDKVNKPSHYNKHGIEAIEAIRASLGDGFEDYCKGNVMKYLWRYKYKNGVEDLKKAQVYLDWMIKEHTTVDAPRKIWVVQEEEELYAYDSKEEAERHIQHYGGILVPYLPA